MQRTDLRTRGGGRVSWDKVREWHGHIYTTKCKTDNQWEAAAQHREISLVLCDHLEWWDMEGGRETQEGGDMGIYVYVQLIHFVIQQKLTQQCKQLYSNKYVNKRKKKEMCSQELMSSALRGHLSSPNLKKRFPRVPSTVSLKLLVHYIKYFKLQKQCFTIFV